MAKQISDPELRAKLTPDFAYGCRRPIFSTNYYEVIQKPNARLIREDIVRVTEDSIIIRKNDGTEEAIGPLDQIVCATGFSVNWVNKFMPVVGRGGKSLADLWEEKPEAYRSVVVHGMPNYMMLGGFWWRQKRATLEEAGGEKKAVGD